MAKLFLSLNINKKGSECGYLLVYDISRLDRFKITATVTAKCYIISDNFIVSAVTNASKNDKTCVKSFQTHSMPFLLTHIEHIQVCR